MLIEINKQEERSPINNLTLNLEELEKQKQTNPKISKGRNNKHQMRNK
jgi:hypothetical protein